LVAPLFEAVPNISEGLDQEKISRIVESVRSVPGIRILDLHTDPDHNRSVITMVGQEESLLEAAEHEASVESTELVGLLPLEALL
jgi:glutamate formiminotransferase